MYVKRRFCSFAAKVTQFGDLEIWQFGNGALSNLKFLHISKFPNHHIFKLLISKLATLQRAKKIPSPHIPHRSRPAVLLG